MKGGERIYSVAISAYLKKPHTILLYFRYLRVLSAFFRFLSNMHIIVCHLLKKSSEITKKITIITLLDSTPLFAREVNNCTNVGIYILKNKIFVKKIHGILILLLVSTICFLCKKNKGRFPRLEFNLFFRYFISPKKNITMRKVRILSDNRCLVS